MDGLSFPFHATESERRILRDLLAVAAIRDGRGLNADFVEEVFLTKSYVNAAPAIADLRLRLFPEECALIAQRENLVKVLQKPPLKAQFDRSLETAELILTARIQTYADFQKLKRLLDDFDAEAWFAHCEQERMRAD